MDVAIALNQLPLGRAGWIQDIRTEDAIKRRLLDLGMVQGTKVRAVLKSPSGDPVAFEVRGAMIALRRDVSSEIYVQTEEAGL